MTFYEVLDQVVTLLQRQGRVSYRALKREFELADDFLEDLKEELITIKELAVDKDGKMLVWTGTPSGQRADSGGQPQAKEAAPARPTPAAPSTEAERRQLTVMFCDLVGSTALSAHLDPEELREVMQQYQETCTVVIRRYDGYVAQHLGDGLLVYFGYPIAHEDEAVRAVHARLEIIAALRQSPLQHRQLPTPLQVRIGIHTGLVVIGEIGSSEKREMLALGEAPNLAARMQGVAGPNTVVMSAITQRLVHGLFECQAMGPQPLKGISTPMLVYRVLGESAAQSRFEVAVGAGLTPLVGREEELGVLQRRWAQAKEGAGQVVLLSGEAGIGKSRLVQALKDQAEAEGMTRVEFRCSPYHQNSAFYPLIEHLQRLLQFAPLDTPHTKLANLQQTLTYYRFAQADTSLLLATLLSLPQPEGMPPLALSPQKQKQKTQEALVAWLLEEAERRAVYCVWEDVHWIDPSTLEVLTLLLDQAPTTRLLALLTFRPDFTPPWRPHSHIAQLTLSRLQRPQVEAMVAQVTGGKALPAEVLQQIIRKTDGVPLFVEELTKTVLESELVRETADRYELTGVLPPLAIPSTLQDSLMARLDRLSAVREIVQLGATLGREFSYELLHLVSPLAEETLQHGLRQLVEAELIYQHGLPPQARYLFKHALIQDTAYQSLLKSKRQHYHQQIAQVLEERFPDTKETQPELLAHHYTEAGLIGQAIPYWQRAGERATQRSANAEAISHLTKGLEVLKTLPDTLERNRQELLFQLALGPAFMVTKSIGAGEVENVYTRARELCQQMGETPQLFPALWGLRRFYVLRADLQTSQELEEQLVRLAQSAHDPALLLEAYWTRGTTSFWLGQMTFAREYFAQSVALYDPQQHHSHAFLYGSDPGVTCHSYNSFTLWHLGYPDQALQESRISLALAHKHLHPFSLVYALSCSAWTHQLRREARIAQEQIEKAIHLATEQGFPFWVAWGSIVRGWALAVQGQGEEGIAQTRQGIATHLAMGPEIALTWFLAMLTDAYKTRGQYEEGLHVLTEALDAVDKKGESAYEAELYRLKGELTLAQSNIQRLASRIQEEAEECLWKALEVARHQQAKSLELRASTSLARLWQQQGKQKEAHRLLSEVYNWLTEGFDTKDLQEAKALLDELARDA